MTHEYESEFHETVAAWLEANFGEANVTYEPRLPATGRVPDFWVRDDLCNYAVEVENDWEAVIKGVGQAVLYAAHSPNTVAVVAVPPGHLEQPEASLIAERTSVVLREVNL